ncbi:hypothetical protein H0H81_005700 [Sphagnurus paluster]|uniref:Uncharacterized protein n=1 Tax=Sphagnurus paluster TaxID=117069 RepID=A0A9P7GSM6_9AGAR|nr:hypothetical protein H0H81_005700 [Sphagnurus paluster]
MPPASASSDSSTSPRAPISPFSLCSAAESDSHYTSDDLPDLGAFSTVLREWVFLQPYPRIPAYHSEPGTILQSQSQSQLDSGLELELGLEERSQSHLGLDLDLDGLEERSRSTASGLGLGSHFASESLFSVERTDTNTNTNTTTNTNTNTEGTGRHSTVWNHQPIAEYLASESGGYGYGYGLDGYGSIEEEDDSEEEDDTDTEGARSVQIETVPDDEDEGQDTDTHGDVDSSLSLPLDTYTPLSPLSPLHTQPSLDGTQDVVLELRGGFRATSEFDEDHDRDEDQEPEEQGEEDPEDSYSYSYTSKQASLNLDLDAASIHDQDQDPFQPSLGYLDEALSFIAAERARLGAQRVAGAGASAEMGSPEAWSHAIEPRRKSRRRRRSTKRSLSSQPHAETGTEASSFVSDTEIRSSGDNGRGTEGDDYDYEEGDDNEEDSEHPPRYRLAPLPPSKSKSTPITPRARIPGLIPLALSSDSTGPTTSISISTFSTSTTPRRRRARSRQKNPPLLAHSRSTPSLRAIAALYPPPLSAPLSAPVPSPPTHTHRLVALARHLARICPAERRRLGAVERQLIAGARSRNDDEQDFDDDQKGVDPRGRPPRPGDPPVHVFIDQLRAPLVNPKSTPHAHHGNTPKPNTSNHTTVTATTTTTTTPIPLPSFATAARSLHLHVPPSPLKSPTKAKANGKLKEKVAVKVEVKVKPKKTPKPAQSPGGSSAGPIPIPTPIPPVPIAVSLSAASDDILLLRDEGPRPRLGAGIGGEERAGWASDSEDGPNRKHRQNGGAHEEDSDSDTISRVQAYFAPTRQDHEEKECDYGPEDKELDKDGDKGRRKDKDEDKNGGWAAPPTQAPQLSHTALTLILERGRPVTRRVVVASSPLYQPMDTMERLGYEVRVYLRVPDLGDGMDRRDRPKTSPKKRRGSGHARRLSGGNSTSTDSTGFGAGVTTSQSQSKASVPTGGTAALTGAPPSSLTLVHQHQLLLHPPQHQHQHPHHPHHPHQHHAHHSSLHQPNHTNPPSGTGAHSGAGAPRIRYREQGVDELLQLKLHQALAATDDVPPGATIVLATGDGNVGQFNEDGFLGPVRTALKRGWRVELYAWEDGLSRAWAREFGAGSEWSRTGMFQIIGMEQFAASLVKRGA